MLPLTSKSNSKPLVIKEQDSLLVKYRYKTDLKSPELVKDNFSYTKDLFIGLFSPPSSKLVMEVKERTKMLQSLAEGALLAHGPWVQSVHLITPKQTLHPDRDPCC